MNKTEALDILSQVLLEVRAASNEEIKRIILEVNKEYDEYEMDIAVLTHSCKLDCYSEMLAPKQRGNIDNKISGTGYVPEVFNLKIASAA